MAAGSYAVFAWWVADRKAATDVLFGLFHNGVASTVTKEQTATG